MELERDGAEIVRGALDEAALANVESALEELPEDQPGVRIRDCPELQPLLASTFGRTRP
jgi:hypothetical protein